MFQILNLIGYFLPPLSKFHNSKVIKTKVIIPAEETPRNKKVCLFSKLQRKALQCNDISINEIYCCFYAQSTM